jgi:hypothetical protein
MNLSERIKQKTDQVIAKFAKPKPKPQPTHGTVTGFEQGLIQVSTSDGQQLRQQQGTRAIGVGDQVIAHDNTAVFTGEAGALPRPGRVFISAQTKKRSDYWYASFRHIQVNSSTSTEVATYYLIRYSPKDRSYTGIEIYRDEYAQRENVCQPGTFQDYFAMAEGTCNPNDYFGSSSEGFLTVADRPNGVAMQIRSTRTPGAQLLGMTGGPEANGPYAISTNEDRQRVFFVRPDMEISSTLNFTLYTASAMLELGQNPANVNETDAAPVVLGWRTLEYESQHSGFIAVKNGFTYRFVSSVSVFSSQFVSATSITRDAVEDNPNTPEDEAQPQAVAIFEDAVEDNPNTSENEEQLPNVFREHEAVGWILQNLLQGETILSQAIQSGSLVTFTLSGGYQGNLRMVDLIFSGADKLKYQNILI